MRYSELDLTLKGLEIVELNEQLSAAQREITRLKQEHLRLKATADGLLRMIPES